MNVNSAYYKKSEFINALAVYFLGLTLECYAFVLLFNGYLLLAFAIHFISSLSLLWPLSVFMPQHFRINITILMFLFLLCFFIPVVSGACLLLSLTVTLHYAKPSETGVFEYTEPLYAVKDLSNPDYCNGRIFGILRFSKDKEKRIKAVLATNQMTDEVAIPILRVALSDSVDEVRLIAHSILDTKEKEIDLIIHKGLEQIKSKKLGYRDVRKIHYKLAEAYWELSYLGLVKGRARDHILNSAMHHANRALKLKSKEVGVFLLQVQILTTLGYFKKADLLLQMVKGLGISPEKLAARNAELAFELKRFSQVGKHVEKLNKLAKNNIMLDGMVKQWK